MKRAQFYDRARAAWPVSCVAVTIILLTSCARARPAAVEGPTLNVCEAGGERVGSRIVVRAELSRPGRESITLTSDDICNGHGAGLVFVTFFDSTEGKKVYFSRPRPKNVRQAPAISSPSREPSRR